MVFLPPTWAPALPQVPDHISIEQFVNDEQYGRFPQSKSRNPFICGITGRAFTANEATQRVDYLARAIGSYLGFVPSIGTEWDRVVAIYSINTIDYIPCALSIHRLSGIVTPVNAVYSVPDLENQLRTSGAKAVITCMPLLAKALEAAKAVGIQRKNIFLLDVPLSQSDPGFMTIDELVDRGKDLPPCKPLQWTQGQGARQTAFLCYSSGTSGLPKAVMTTHYNVIANIQQIVAFESVARKEFGIETHNVIGVLPFSHIYSLVYVALLAQFRGDQLVVLPRFDARLFFAAIDQFRLNLITVVPPIVASIIANKELAGQYDLQSVRLVASGGGHLSAAANARLREMFPNWRVGQGYGMTEASPVIAAESEHELVSGSSGCLLPGYKAKLIDVDGNEVTGYDEKGELYVQSPSIARGYLANPAADEETFICQSDGRWLRTGDEALFRKSSSGSDHLFITARVKELIKVLGFQVAPAELEEHLLKHPFVADCAVVSVPNDIFGEVPKAYVVKSTEASSVETTDVIRSIMQHVEKHKTDYKWLKGGIDFVDSIPRGSGGKILRRLLRTP